MPATLKEAEALREKLDEVWSEATEMGERSYPVGMILSYYVEVGVKAVNLPAAKYGPGAEVGLAFSLRRILG